MGYYSAKEELFEASENLYGPLLLHVVWDIADGRLSDAMDVLYTFSPFQQCSCSVNSDEVISIPEPLSENFNSTSASRYIRSFSTSLPAISASMQVLVCFLRYKLDLILHELELLSVYEAVLHTNTSSIYGLPSETYMLHHFLEIVPFRLKLY